MPYRDSDQAKAFRKKYNIRTREKYQEYRAKRHEEYAHHYRNNAWKRRGIVLPNGAYFTIRDYDLFLEAQNNKCAVCRIDRKNVKTNFAVDHDHKTGIARGLLCSLCNRFLVFILDNHYNLVPKALTYLRIHNKNVPERIEAT